MPTVKMIDISRVNAALEEHKDEMGVLLKQETDNNSTQWENMMKSVFLEMQRTAVCAWKRAAKSIDTANTKIVPRNPAI